MLRQWFVIANLKAGRLHAQWGALQQQIAAALPVGGWACTQYSGHGIALAQDAIAEGYRHILAVGGDGTNHEVANGILQQPFAPPTSITYALLPLGTGNDWSRTYGMPRRPADALQLIARGTTRLQDAGLLHYHRTSGEAASRYFVNVAGLAYDAFVVQRSIAEPAGQGGPLRYLSLVARCLFEYQLKEAIVTSEGQAWQDYFYTINLGIGRYSGGGMQLVPHAVPDGGTFALTMAGPLSKAGVLLNTWRFYNGSIGRHPLVKTLHARQITVSAAPGAAPTLLEADGEFLGQTPVRASICPAAFQFIAPQPQTT